MIPRATAKIWVEVLTRRGVINLTSYASITFPSGCMSSLKRYVRGGSRTTRGVKARGPRCVYTALVASLLSLHEQGLMMMKQYFAKIGGDLGFGLDTSKGYPVSDTATAGQLERVYGLYLKVLIGKWNAVAKQSWKNIPNKGFLPSGPSETLEPPWICQSR